MGAITDAAAAWDDVADAWGRSAGYVEGHSRPATAAMIDALAVRPGDRVLELAAGPGVLAPAWSELVGPTGAVVVSDFSPAMVEAAHRQNAHLANVDFAVVDFSAIDAGDAAFDVVASRMGVMFTPDPAAAFAEMRRVLAPGGRLGVMTWAGPDRNPWMACVGMAAMANGISAEPSPFEPGGIFSLGDPARLATLAAEAGFTDVAVNTVDLAFTAADIDSHVRQVSSLAGPLAAAFKAASPEQLAATTATAAELAAPYRHADGSLTLPGCALVLTARA